MKLAKYIKEKEELEKYYSKEMDAYLFEEDVNITFDIDTKSRIISCGNLVVGNLKAEEIKASNIIARDLISNTSIRAKDIIAFKITAKTIDYFKMCCAYYELNCDAIHHKSKKAKCICLEKEIKLEEENE